MKQQSTENPTLSVRFVAVDALIPYARNSRTHSDAQVAQIAASLREFGWTNPILIDGENGIIAGHGRLLAARKLGQTEVPVIELAHLSDAQRRAYVIADNKLAESAGWDDELLRLEVADLSAQEFDMSALGFTQKELADLLGTGDDAADIGEAGSGALSARFMLPPFSVLNAREGWWQARKRAWLALGIKSEVGRDKGMLGGSAMNGSWHAKKVAEGQTDMKVLNIGDGTSVFDPVMCEIAYRWFSPPDGLVIDPFAGGSVRGIVAAKTGRQYVGMDLRGEQVQANREQAAAILDEADTPPVWIAGDSRTIADRCADVRADMLFTCPPYADLEVYSDDPADISTLRYPEFRDAYREIIGRACSLLKPDRFACIVVGEVRGPDGAYYDFVGDTVQAFRDAGLAYYNEAILVTAVGTLAIRAGRGFTAARKLGKTHQNVLVFVKGDPKRAVQACGDVEVDAALLDELESGGDQG